jgi:hypothetical protein
MPNGKGNPACHNCIHGQLNKNPNYNFYSEMPCDVAMAWGRCTLHGLVLPPGEEWLCRDLALVAREHISDLPAGMRGALQAGILYQYSDKLRPFAPFERLRNLTFSGQVFETRELGWVVMPDRYRVSCLPADGEDVRLHMDGRVALFRTATIDRQEPAPGQRMAKVNAVSAPRRVLYCPGDRAAVFGWIDSAYRAKEMVAQLSNPVHVEWSSMELFGIPCFVEVLEPRKEFSLFHWASDANAPWIR